MKKRKHYAHWNIATLCEQAHAAGAEPGTMLVYPGKEIYEGNSYYGDTITVNRYPCAYFSDAGLPYVALMSRFGEILEKFLAADVKALPSRVDLIREANKIKALSKGHVQVSSYWVNPSSPGGQRCIEEGKAPPDNMEGLPLSTRGKNKGKPVNYFGTSAAGSVSQVYPPCLKVKKLDADEEETEEEADSEAETETEVDEAEEDETEEDETEEDAEMQSEEQVKKTTKTGCQNAARVCLDAHHNGAAVGSTLMYDQETITMHRFDCTYHVCDGEPQIGLKDHGGMVALYSLQHAEVFLSSDAMLHRCQAKGHQQVENRWVDPCTPAGAKAIELGRCKWPGLANNPEYLTSKGKMYSDNSSVGSTINCDRIKPVSLTNPFDPQLLTKYTLDAEVETDAGEDEEGAAYNAAGSTEIDETDTEMEDQAEDAEAQPEVVEAEDQAEDQDQDGEGEIDGIDSDQAEEDQDQDGEGEIDSDQAEEDQAAAGSSEIFPVMQCWEIAKSRLTETLPGNRVELDGAPITAYGWEMHKTTDGLGHYFIVRGDAKHGPFDPQMETLLKRAFVQVNLDKGYEHIGSNRFRAPGSSSSRGTSMHMSGYCKVLRNKRMEDQDKDGEGAAYSDNTAGSPDIESEEDQAEEDQAEDQAAAGSSEIDGIDSEEDQAEDQDKDGEGAAYSDNTAGSSEIDKTDTEMEDQEEDEKHLAQLETEKGELQELQTQIEAKKRKRKKRKLQDLYDRKTRLERQIAAAAQRSAKLERRAQRQAAVLDIRHQKEAAQRELAQLCQHDAEEQQLQGLLEKMEHDAQEQQLRERQLHGLLGDPQGDQSEVEEDNML